MKAKSNTGARKTLIAYLVASPSLLLIGLIVVFPILYTAYISLTNMNTYHWFNYSIIGLDNYKRALFMFDSGFLSALLNTVVWTVVNMVLQLVIAFLISNLLNVKRLPLRNFYKTILMFPWAMPGYVSILLWKTGMFNSQFGLLTQWMEKLSGLTVRWLQNDVSAFLCCTAVNLWLALPFMIMIMDGGLKSIDRSYYESATLDGAGPIRQAVSITLPCLRPIIGPSVVITVFTTFKQFDIIYLMTQQVGAQTGAHIHTIITYAYENAFITNNYGFSSAISILIFALLIVFAQISNRREKEETV
ncbi:MAG: sugar ABC transporter permease [Clostridia bacterium]|nr:sugar ABC transporter permease [Clostridia bacterium]